MVPAAIHILENRPYDQKTSIPIRRVGGRAAGGRTVRKYLTYPSPTLPDSTMTSSLPPYLHRKLNRFLLSLSMAGAYAHRSLLRGRGD